MIPIVTMFSAVAMSARLLGTEFRFDESLLPLHEKDSFYNFILVLCSHDAPCFEGCGSKALELFSRIRSVLLTSSCLNLG